MQRVLLLLGFVEVLFPKRIVELGERLAFEDDGGATLRPWTMPIARAEGIMWLVLVRNRSVRSKATRLLGVVGLLMAFLPDAVVDAALRVAYRNADRIAMKPWVVPATRALGFGYVLVGIRAVVRSRSDEFECLGTRGDADDILIQARSL